MLLGKARQGLGEREAAAAAHRRALEIDPSLADARRDLGDVLQEQGRLDDAIAQYRAALGLERNAQTLVNLGCALVRNGALEEAAALFREAISLRPDQAAAHMNLGSTYTLLGERERAKACHEAALALQPGDGAIRECLLAEMQATCDWSRFDELCAQQRRAATDPNQVVTPFSLLSIPSAPEEQLQCARSFGRRLDLAAQAERRRLGFRFASRPRERLTIGYLSADFHDHVTAYVMAEMFELHDHGRFRVHAYSYGPNDGSAMRARLERAFDRFVDAQALSHADLASAIHADGVDILVDLKGYTQHARTEVMALRPAPVQAAYMGYPGTLAAPFIDYLFADRYVVPAGSERHYGEKLVFLPGSYYVNDRLRAAGPAPSRRDLALPEGAVVFCCFNQTYKILPDVFDAWMRILRAVPDGVLWLLDTNSTARRNLGREAAKRGVDPARLVFAPRAPSPQHLARVAAADLFLDTRPYNAHTTATDALWMGVPVLTTPGSTFASRVAGSLLSALGVPELIAPSPAEYEARAIDLARSPDTLAALRAKVLRQRESAPLFDTALFTRNVEKAYERMWNRQSAGEAPASFDV